MTKKEKGVGSNQYEDKDKVKVNVYLRFVRSCLVVAILYALLLIGMYYYNNVYKAEPFNPLLEDWTGDIRSDNTVTPKERRDTTSAVIDKYFESKRSPLFGLGMVFYDTAKRYGLPVYLLPAISMAESSGAKHYYEDTNNFMGWGRGRIPFASKDECIETVGYKIATLPYYRDFMANPEDLGEFCMSYNMPEAKVYCRTLRRFMEEIKQVELEI